MGHPALPELRRLLPLLPQQFLQHANPFVHVLLLQQERGQEANHGILGAVEEHTFRQTCVDNRTRRDLQLNPLDETAPAYFRGGCALLRQRFQLLLQVRTHFVYVLEQLLFFHDRQKFQGDAAGQRTSAESGAMLPWRNRRGKLFLGQERAQRQPRRDGLRDRDDVRRDAETLERKNRSRAPQATLNLVKDQRGAVAVGQRAAFLQELDRALINSAFAENRLQHNRAGFVADGGAQTFEVILLYKSHFFEQRLEPLAMLVLPGERQRSERAPVIGAIERHQAALCRSAGAMPRQPRQLDRAFDRLSSAVGEKCAVESGELTQLLGQRSLIFVVIQIRNMHQLGRLLANRLHDARMRVPQRIHSQPGDEIQVALALQVKQKHALAPAERDGIAVVCLQQILPFKFSDLFKSIHGNDSIL